MDCHRQKIAHTKARLVLVARALTDLEKTGLKSSEVDKALASCKFSVKWRGPGSWRMTMRMRGRGAKAVCSDKGMWRKQKTYTYDFRVKR